jgi:hypothetical protein
MLKGGGVAWVQKNFPVRWDTAPPISDFSGELLRGNTEDYPKIHETIPLF